jgi:cardiolipin synthase
LLGSADQESCAIAFNVVNIPNFITLARAVLVPVVFWLLISGWVQAAFILFVLAGISDAIDGYLAKRFNWHTDLGAHLDPLADKLLIVSVFLALGFLSDLPSWLVVAVVSRDILIVLAVMISWLLDRPMAIRPLVISKANTTAQLVLAGTVLADEGFGLGLGDVRQALVWITAILTVWSLLTYMRAWLRHMALYESQQTDAADR